MRTLTVKIPEQLERRIAVTIKDQGWTKSDLVRAALEAFLNNPELASKGSALDSAGELVGSFEGPEDLSTSADYMDDYGR